MAMGLHGCLSPGVSDADLEAWPPANAQELADRYGPITDLEISRWIGSEHFLAEEFRRRSSAADDSSIRLRRIGEGRSEIIVTEHLVMREPYRVELDRRSYFDPLSNAADEDIVKITVGNIFSEPDRCITITDTDELAAVVRILRTGTFFYSTTAAYRARMSSDGSSRMIQREATMPFVGTGCGSGVAISGPDGKTVRWQWLGWPTRHYWHHDGLLPYLESISEAHGVTIYKRPGYPVSYLSGEIAERVRQLEPLDLPCTSPGKGE